MTPPGQHTYDQCPNTVLIHETVLPTQTQHDKRIGTLETKEAHRAGGEAMLKWILGFAGVSGITGIVGLIVNLWHA